MNYSATSLGKTVRKTRKLTGVTQKELALTSGTGIRFIIELEKGKSTCQLGKALTVLNTLGIKIELTPPPGLDVVSSSRGTGSGKKRDGKAMGG